MFANEPIFLLLRIFCHVGYWLGGGSAQFKAYIRNLSELYQNNDLVENLTVDFGWFVETVSAYMM